MTRCLAMLPLFLALVASAAPSSRYSPHSLSRADEEAIQRYDLTAARGAKLVRVGARLRDYLIAHPAKNFLLPTETVDQSVKRIESMTELAAILKEEEISPREWLLGTFALVLAAQSVEMDKKVPGAFPRGANLKNIEFLKKNPGLLQEWIDASKLPETH